MAYEKARSDLQRAIEDELGCKALWERWQVVRVMDGPTVTVGVFRLANYQDATRCYAWANPEQGAKPYVVLRRGTAHDPITTVLSVHLLGRSVTPGRM
jgi:hypothetical protein